MGVFSTQANTLSNTGASTGATSKEDESEAIDVSFKCIELILIDCNT